LSGTKSKSQDALTLARDLRVKIQDDQIKISTLLMGCKTVCRYLGNLEENTWIEQELNGYDISKFKKFVEQEKSLPDYREVSCIYYGQFNEPLIFSDSKTRETFSTFKLPNAITELETVKDLVIASGPLLDGTNKLLSESGGYLVVKAIVTNNHIHAVLAGIKNRIYEFLDETILGLEYGGIPELIFEDVRKEVDSKMVSLCPDAINKLQVAYENASSANPESWSHVASSCRRIINDVADTIFPAQPQPVKVDGKEYSVTDDKFINRIIVGLKSKSTSKRTFEFNQSMIEYVQAFLRNIQSYSSKGDHSAFTKPDASRCVVYTYLLLGDILKYYIDIQKH
jgi:hypothetical protein